MGEEELVTGEHIPRALKTKHVFFFSLLPTHNGHLIHVARVCPPVALCYDISGVVGSNLTMFRLEPTTPNMLQHVATWRNMAQRANKRGQHVAPGNVTIYELILIINK